MNRLIFSPFLCLTIFVTANESFAQKAVIIDNLKVARVIDGGTIQLTTGAGVKYLGVNIPRHKYFAATEANRQLVEGKSVKLEFDVDIKDRDGNLVAYAFVDSIFVNAWLIKEGYAKISIHPRNARYQHLFLRLEKSAREANVGVWAESANLKKKTTQLKRTADFDLEKAFVYITRGGEKYHRAKCTEIKNIRIPISLRKAMRSYKHCKICRPLEIAQAESAPKK